MIANFKKWLGLAAIAVAVQAQAQANYPSKPVRIIAPFAPGGSVEVLARQVGQRLSVRLGQPVVVETRPGGGGSIGTEAVMRSEPDGYTLLLHSGAIVTDPLLKKTKFDARTDLEPIIMLANVALAVVVPPQFPVTNVAGLIDYAKKNPGKLNYATPGLGSSVHLATEMFKFMSGTYITHIPYKGGSPAITAVMAGEVQLLFSPIVTAKPLAAGGRVRALAVTTSKRSSSWPEIPTLAEAGVPGYDFGAWYGMFAPPKTPPAIVQRLNRELLAVLQDPTLKTWLSDNGMEPMGNTPGEFRTAVGTEIERFDDMLKKVHIKVE